MRKGAAGGGEGGEKTDARAQVSATMAATSAAAHASPASQSLLYMVHTLALRGGKQAAGLQPISYVSYFCVLVRVRVRVCARTLAYEFWQVFVALNPRPETPEP